MGAAANPPELLAQVGRILNAEGVRWAVIGALAVAYHGWIRASLDADALITLRDAKGNLDALVGKLRERGWQVESRMGDEDDPLGFVVRIVDASGNQVDLIGGIRRLDPDFFARSIEDDSEGMALRISSPEDLIALKIFAGGPKDMEDARGLVDMLGTSLDKDLVLTLCRRFGTEEEARGKKLLWS